MESAQVDEGLAEEWELLTERNKERETERSETTAIKQFMAGFDSDTTATKDITFSSLTQPGTFQVAIESSVEKRQGRTFGPPSGKRMIVFVDDLSMPVMNEWGDQITNEVVRQLLEQGGRG